MKFTCPQTELNACLSQAIGVRHRNPSKPLLRNVLLKADASAEMVTLIGFDENLAIETSFHAAVDADGELTLPAQSLKGVVSQLPSDNLTVETIDTLETNAAIAILSSTGDYQVRGLYAEDCPSLPLVGGGQVAKISAEALLEGSRGTLFATSSTGKSVLTGVHLRSEADVLEFAATDGHRLAVASVQLAKGAANSRPVNIDATVPAKAMRELEKLVKGNVPKTLVPIYLVTVRLDGAYIAFEIGRRKLTTQLLDGQFPNYHQVIPQQSERQATVNRRQLIDGLKRAATLANKRSKLVRVSLDCAQQTLALSVEAQEAGRSYEAVPAQITGEPLAANFNAHYLLDALKAIGTTEVLLELNSATSPAKITPIGDQHQVHVVMPVVRVPTRV